MRIGLPVLDVNLRGEFVHALADRLEAAHIPFIFATGYGRIGIPNHWASKPVVQKPFTRDALASGLRFALGQ